MFPIASKFPLRLVYERFCFTGNNALAAALDSFSANQAAFLSALYLL